MTIYFDDFRKDECATATCVDLDASRAQTAP